MGMRQNTKPLWSLGCSALVLLMVMLCAEDAMASRRSFGRHSLRAPSTRFHHRPHRHHWRHHHRRHHHRHHHFYRRHYPDSFFSFRFRYGYPFWPYYYEPYYYRPGYVTPYSPGVHQRFPDFRHPGFFSYPGSLGKLEGDIYLTEPEKPGEESQIPKPDEIEVEPPP